MNSFLALRQQDIVEFRREHQEIVRQRVEKQIETAEFVGGIIELFLPKMVDTITALGGGDPSLDDDYITFPQPEDDASSDDLGPSGPNFGGDIIR